MWQPKSIEEREADTLNYGFFVMLSSSTLVFRCSACGCSVDEWGRTQHREWHEKGTRG